MNKDNVIRRPKTTNDLHNEDKEDADIYIEEIDSTLKHVDKGQPVVRCCFLLMYKHSCFPAKLIPFIKEAYVEHGEWAAISKSRFSFLFAGMCDVDTFYFHRSIKTLKPKRAI